LEFWLKYLWIVYNKKQAEKSTHFQYFDNFSPLRLISKFCQTLDKIFLMV